MFEVGQILSGYVINNSGEKVKVTGKFVLRTDDPEEFIQDIILDIDGKYVYVDEQCICRS